MDILPKLEAIAKKHLAIETLSTRKSDSLDFYDVPVWGIKDALVAAYNAGQGLNEDPCGWERTRMDY